MSTSCHSIVYFSPVVLSLLVACASGSAERSSEALGAGSNTSTPPDVGGSSPTGTGTAASDPGTASGTAAPPAPTASEAPAPGATAGGGGGGGSGNTSQPTAMSPVAKHGQLKVVGSEIHDASGAAITLRGQGFGWDNWWPQYYNADVVNWLRDDWCIDLVRPAMGIEPDGAYLANPDASRGRIRAVVDAAIAKGVYVIIDWHAHDMHQAEATAFFSEMAQAYGDQPNVIYEIFNEPDEETWPEVKAYAEAVGAAIRQYDPDNLIIVGSPEWDQRIDLVAEDPITALTNVVYSVHFYAATHTGWLRDRTAAAKAAGIPVIVSESSGSEASGMGANEYTEWQAWFDFMDQNSISWINYSVSDKSGETISVLEPRASATGGWDAAQLTETGEYIRDVFRGSCK